MFLGSGLGGRENEWTLNKAKANQPSPFLPGRALAWATEAVTDSSHSRQRLLGAKVELKDGPHTTPDKERASESAPGNVGNNPGSRARSQSIQMWTL